MLEESRRMLATPFENSITRNHMTGSKQPVQISLPTTKIVGAVKHSIGIVNPFLTALFNQPSPTSNKKPERDTETGNTSPSGVLIVELMRPYLGGILITSLG